MTDLNSGLGNIPSIGSSQIGINPVQMSKDTEKPDVAMFDNAPNDVSLGSFFGKFFIGLLVGLCVVALLFGTLAAVGGIADTSDGIANSTLKIVLAIVGFIVNFIGSFALALMYNIFFSKRYYNFGKMFALIFVSSLIFFVFFLVLYLLYSKINDLYVLLGFQIIFGLYITLNLIDFLSQPNYSASSMLGNTLGCVLTVVTYISVTQLVNFTVGDNIKLKTVIFLAILPVILAYTLMIIGAGIWDAIYYKFYEWGNNPFYLPSINELREERQKEEKEKEKEEEEVNVEMK